MLTFMLSSEESNSRLAQYLQRLNINSSYRYFFQKLQYHTHFWTSLCPRKRKSCYFFSRQKSWNFIDEEISFYFKNATIKTKNLRMIEQIWSLMKTSKRNAQSKQPKVCFSNFRLRISFSYVLNLFFFFSFFFFGNYPASEMKNCGEISNPIAYMFVVFKCWN